MGVVLGIDTCGRHLAVALLVDGEPRYHLSREASRLHSRILLPHVQTAMESAGVAPSQLTAIAVVSGPGSYTGIRIGMATAEGLARSLSCRLVAVPTFLAWALEHGHAGETVLGCIEAGRHEVFCGAYRREEETARCVIEEAVVTAKAFSDYVDEAPEPRLVLGAAGPSGRSLLTGVTGALGAARFAGLGGEADDALVFHPLYVRQASIRKCAGGFHATGK